MEHWMKWRTHSSSKNVRLQDNDNGLVTKDYFSRTQAGTNWAIYNSLKSS